ncbi:hypothetical protein [Maritalea mediterranea]|uniref:Uncharacterized protein n=1 Tax=Maritalea mediterranea TaxID=2909667 RepID=A0ABS9E945_9HYPH|nr:hypothetical protein [Maritalea mediterranea]MCF4098709.1 hypothetical protein [Maritalea mediterranea]
MKFQSETNWQHRHNLSLKQQLKHILQQLNLLPAPNINDDWARIIYQDCNHCMVRAHVRLHNIRVEPDEDGLTQTLFHASNRDQGPISLAASQVIEAHTMQGRIITDFGAHLRQLMQQQNGKRGLWRSWSG